jgi:hypothetical protein
MANTLGSGENPVYIDDSDESTGLSHSTRGGIAGNIDFDGDEPVEKPIGEIPSQIRVRSKRSFNRPTTIRRSSAATPNTSTIIDLTLSDDESNDLNRHDTQQRSQAREGSSEVKAATTSRRRFHPVRPNIEPTAGTIPQSNLLAEQGKQSLALQPAPSSTQPKLLPRGTANAIGNPEGKSDASSSLQHNRPKYDHLQKVHLPPLGAAPGHLYLPDVGSGSKSSIPRVDIIDRNSPDSPIGGRADEREQTTLWRVEKNATLSSRRVNNTDKIGKPSPPPGRSERTHSSAGPRVSQLPLKPRAVKSAGSPPRRKAASGRPPYRLARNHAHPSKSPPGSNEDLLGEDLSRERRLDKRPSTNSNTDPSDHRRNLGSAAVTHEVLPKETLSFTDARHSNMGAQFSGPTAPGPSSSDSLLAEAAEGMSNVESAAKELILSPSEMLRIEAGSSAQPSSTGAKDRFLRGKFLAKCATMRAPPLGCDINGFRSL